MSTVTSATAYAERLGWRIFLVSEDCKVPIRHEGWEHGRDSASSDPAELRRRLALYPRANIALACGSDSGILALDIDAKDGKDGFVDLATLEREFEPVPVTWKQRTPSGGAHILFKHPIGVNPQNRVGMKRYHADGSRTVYAGLDVRAQGASIALSPSRKPTGSYSWEVKPQSVPLAPVPRWLLGLMLSEPPPMPKRPPQRFTSYDKAARYAEKAIDGECGELSRMGAGSGRNQRLFIAAARLGELVAAGLCPQSVAEDELERAAHDCGLVKDDGIHGVRATIKSGLTQGLKKPREVQL